MKKPPARRPQPLDPDEADTTTILAAEWSGPLPPPEILAQFDSVVENGAERIMSAWEQETAHRHRIENEDLRNTFIEAMFGKVAALVFVVSALGVALAALLLDHDWVGAVIGGGTIATVVGAFISVHSGQRHKD